MEEWQSERRVLAFFKVYLPTSAKKMQIPIAYVTYMNGNIPKTSVLRHQDGKVWNVRVEKTGSGFYFCGGWENYVRDNFLETGDFLIFQYDGHQRYDITLLGRYGLAKSVVALDEAEEEEETRGNVNETELGSRVEVEIVEEEEEEDGENDQVKEAVGGDKASSIDSKKSKEEKSGKRKRAVADPHDHGIFTSGLVSRPKNPYFLSSLRKERKNELFVPFDFIKDHNLCLPSVIMLRDQDGRKWESKQKVWKDGRVWYYKGWGRLCRINRVAENDICICELKKGRDGDQFFLVQIVREEIIHKACCGN